MRQAYNEAASFSPSVLVERLITGRNYRLLVVNYKLVAASERTPCAVTGDGKHTLKELIDIENANPLRGEGHEKLLTKIRVDHSVVQHLKRVGLTTKHVPAVKEAVTLSDRRASDVGPPSERVS